MSLGFGGKRGKIKKHIYLCKYKYLLIIKYTHSVKYFGTMGETKA